MFMNLLKYIILSSVVLFSTVNLDAAERSVSFPSCSILVKEGNKSSGKQSTEFRIVSVSASPERTAVSCELDFVKKVKGYYFINSDCSLVYHTADSVARSVITDADGLQIRKGGEELSNTIYKRGDRLEFTLYFDPLPEDVERFDLIEDLYSSWNRVDISLTDGAVSREEQRTGTCPYENVIKEPTFMGQDKNSFSKWVTPRLRYLEDLRLSEQEGKMTFEMVIDAEGYPHFQIIKASLPAFNAEALRVVTDSPQWTPATVRGKPVRCTLIFPVIFQLRTGMTDSSSVPFPRP